MKKFQRRPKSEYATKYREKELIGTGTSGSATLVKNIEEKKFYVSKKIRLSALTDDEKKSAQQELKLLSQFKHPNIISYKESFMENETLIIIMEYAEEGDLAYHTDIKTTNIFLSSCGSVKIGDFGIAKQLDATNENAKTLVGTPYYLSPEVCLNLPYTYKSDIWALGCVVFELCTLNHPFKSENLMGLLNTIIKEQPPELPKQYTQEFIKFNKNILNKDANKRFSTKQIMENQFILSTMKKFVLTKGEIQDKQYKEEVPIKKLTIHKQKEFRQSQLENNSSNFDSQNIQFWNLDQKIKEKVDRVFSKNSTNKKNKDEEDMYNMLQESLTKSVRDQYDGLKSNQGKSNQSTAFKIKQTPLKVSDLDDDNNNDLSQTINSEYLTSFKKNHDPHNINLEKTVSSMMMTGSLDKNEGNSLFFQAQKNQKMQKEIAQNSFLQDSNASFNVSLTADSVFGEQLQKEKERFLKKSVKKNLINNEIDFDINDDNNDQFYNTHNELNAMKLTYNNQMKNTTSKRSMHEFDLLEVRDDDFDSDKSGSEGEEFYNVDFEYSDDEADKDQPRITKVNKFKELDEILDLYTNQLQNSSLVSQAEKKQFKKLQESKYMELEQIREMSRESISTNQSQ